MKSNVRRAKGFTLIELLIVIAIIAILALIAVPNFLNAQLRAQISRVNADMRSLATAIEAYMVDHNNYPIFTGTMQGNPNHPKTYFYFLSINPGYGTSTVDPDNPMYNPIVCTSLTTPIAYIANLPVDPFGGWEPHYDDERSYMFVNFLGASWPAATDSLISCGYPTYDPPSPVVSPTTFRWNSPDWPPLHVQWLLMSPGPKKEIVFPIEGTGKSMTYIQFLCGADDRRLNHDLYRDIAEGIVKKYDPTNGLTSRGHIARFSGGAQ